MDRRPALRVWIALLLLLTVLALLVGWRARPQAATSAEAIRPTRPIAQAASGPTGAAPKGLLWNPLTAAQSVAGSAPPLASVKPNMAESDWQALDREWCNRVQPFRQALQKAGGVLSDVETPVDAPAVDDSALFGLGDPLVARVARALAARASPRERAVGLWLAGKGQELMAEAEASRDPVVVALAAQRLTEPMQSRAIRLWRAVEPGNMVPLIYAQSLDPQPTAQWLAALSHASAYDTHIPQVFEIAFSVPPPTHDSPSELALHMALVGLHAAFPMPELRPLMQPCRQPGSTSIAQQCAQVAERLWALKSGDLLMPHLAVALVRGQPALHPGWQARAQQVEAVSQLQSESIEASLTSLTHRLACLPQPKFIAALDERLRQGDWAFWSAQLPSDPAAQVALSERYRQARQGKDLLSPRP